MNTPLDEAYRDLAADARNYADPDRVLHEARRRRTRRATLLVAAVVTAVASALGVAQLVRPPSQIAAPAPAVRTIAPPPSSTPLPQDSAVGRGTLVYTACQFGCPTYLVVEDGRQFLLDEQTEPPPGNLTLSPDGRWLGRPTSTGYSLRDLLGTDTRLIEVPRSSGVDGLRLSPWGWADDSQQAILGAHTDGDVARYLSVSLPSGRTATAAVPAGTEPVGLSRSGDLLLLDERSYGRLPLTRVDLQLGDTGPGIRIQTVAPSTVLADQDHGLTLQVRNDRIYALTHATSQAAVVQYDLRGRTVGEARLGPADAPLGPVDEGYAVLSVPASGGATAELTVLSGTTRRVLAVLPSAALVVLPGSSRH